MSAPSTPIRPVQPPARVHPMVTRQQARQQAQQQAHHAHNADTGFMPPESGYAPVRGGARSRIFA